MPEPVATRPNMPGYGLQSPEDGLLSWAWAQEVLASAWTYWVATARPDGRPHLMPVWAVWADGVLLFSTGASSRKARNLAANPSCSVSVEVARQSVIVEGSAALLEGEAALRGRFNALYLAKYEFDMSDWRDPIYVVTPSVAFGFIDQPGQFESTATRWTFPL